MQNWIEKTNNPFDVFENWYLQALDNSTFEPTKFTLASADSQGMPSARVVLLKEYGSNGFCFYTNYESTKGKELLANPKAALVFHWEKPFHRQVRIRGLVEKMSYAESDVYFQTRSRGSKIGAWSSPQSSEITDRQELVSRVEKIESQFDGKDIPCPENWGGFRLKPLNIEFWQAQDFRLHDRMNFSRSDVSEAWQAHRLAP